MNSKVRALIWEECRTGGAIAAAMTVLGAVMLILCRRTIGPDAWLRDPTFAGYGLYGVPLMTALMLILNPDYAGHLTGGFSRRILRLPLTTAAAVAPALVSRCVFVLTSSSILTAISMGQFGQSPGFEVTLGIGLFYLAAQLVDWLRGPFSGLSSLLVLAALAEAMGRILPSPFDASPIRWTLAVLPRSPVFYGVVLVPGLAVVYVVAVAAVNADRVGRRYGIPEIWHWPRYVSFGPSRRRAPFRSPMAAQVWFDLRRSRGLFPLVTLLAWGVIALAVWLNALAHPSQGTNSQYLRLYISFALGPALLLGALVQGAFTRVVGFRRTTGKPGYELLQPLSTAGFARARMTANLILVLSTVGAALALHFALAGGLWTTDLIPRGLRLGATTLREAGWIVLSRGLLIGTTAWALLAVGTRVFRRIFGWGILLESIYLLYGSVSVENQFAHRTRPDWMVFSAVLVFLTPALLFSVRRSRLATRRTTWGWVAVWGLAAWLFLNATISPWREIPASFVQYAAAALTALGYSSLIPLAFLGVLIDVRRKRHGAACPQDPAQNAARQRGRAMAAAASVALAAGAVWLGWPARPAYVDYLRARGYPTTRAELNAWYVAVPPAENVALDYIKLGDEATSLQQEYWKRQMGPPPYPPNQKDIKDKWLIVGGARYWTPGQIDKDVWEATEAYRSEVSSQVTPRLKELAARDTLRARYPMDFEKHNSYGPWASDRLQGLGSDLSLDALHWALASQPDRAVDSVAAIFAIAHSLTPAPWYYAQMVRQRFLTRGAESIHTMLNRSAPPETELLRLQRLCESELGRDQGFERGLIGETTLELSSTSLFPHEAYESDRFETIPDLFDLTMRMGFPPAAQRLIGLMQLEDGLANSQRPKAYSGPRNFRAEAEQMGRILFLSPTIGIYWNNYDWEGVSTGTVRMRFEAARVALAIERYRLAQGKLPETLDRLVPTYLSEVPKDYFATGGAPLSYRVRPNGSYAVYSIGQDGKDTLDVDQGKLRTNDEIVFQVASQNARLGPQIASE